MPFLPLFTPRLTIRMVAVDDRDAIVAYRSDPEVARYQDWDLPYTSDRFDQAFAERAHITDLDDNMEANLAVELTETGELLGDLYVGLQRGRAHAAIGYTFDAQAQGKGYATEAVEALVDALVAGGTRRFVATLDPENIASAQLLERVGFSFECIVKQGDFVRGEWVDDLRYAMTADERHAWRTRDLRPATTVELIEVTPANRREVFSLATHRSQERFVSPMARSAADALVVDVDEEFGQTVPWFRAIQADGVIAGFVMLAEPNGTMLDPYLWRLLIDKNHQRRGIGWQVLNQIVERYRSMGHDKLFVSWHPGKGGPEPMYLKYGFVPTGRIDDGEVEGVLTL